MRSYRELITIPTFKERYEYLKLSSVPGRQTFGFERYLNQTLYQSREWRRLRSALFVRDEARDLAMPGYDITDRFTLHHLNPITIEDIEKRAKKVLDPDNLVVCSHNTHNAIHFGDARLLIDLPPPRKKGDTCPWTVVS